MSTRYALVVVLLAAVALLVVSCQKEANISGPTSVNPSNILGPNGGPVTYVYPSGGDDAAEIQSALDDCEPGGTVMLMEGTFHLGSAVQVDNFSGALRGAGKDKTVVTTLPGVQIGLVFLHAWEFSSSTLFYFHGDGDIAVSDMTIAVLDPAPAEYTPGFGNNLLCPIVIDGVHVSTTLERIKFHGASGSWFGYNVGWGTCIAGYCQPPDAQFMTGNHVVEDCEYDMMYMGYNPQYQTDGILLVKGNLFTDVLVGVYPNDISNCDMRMTRNEMVNPGYAGMSIYQGYYFASGVELSPSRFLIEHNIIHGEGPSAIGIELLDHWYRVHSVSALEAVVSNNKISLDTQWGGIYDVCAQNAVITNNIFSGVMMSAMFPGVYGTATTNWTILGNNVQNYRPHYSGFDAAIWLGAKTSHCKVVGGSCKTNVYDRGTGNILVGVTKIGGEGLGEEIKEGMQQRMEVRKGMPW